jgi:hypothetical protein
MIDRLFASSHKFKASSIMILCGLFVNNAAALIFSLKDELRNSESAVGRVFFSLLLYSFAELLISSPEVFAMFDQGLFELYHLCKR